ncbi:hypothetical protein BgramDRAFT_6690 [Paraburkholderia graminis C4D1M]|uniref:Calcineurin-like phosphoesterase domain-containing protein n=1 Tax=Paraburkholderia graminis (strain ATCC 700544 / DSM 17151 / LMG 18924 / NCIMB 13744 / C4D1M) TaxID=396598 RepID=B1GBF5_PARG4|nr:hypothetical protein BgramDRAFT_6690 [Paraburkholderia graminis C4D1M]
MVIRELADLFDPLGPWIEHARCMSQQHCCAAIQAGVALHAQCFCSRLRTSAHAGRMAFALALVARRVATATGRRRSAHALRLLPALTFPMRRSSFLVRLIFIGILLHIYVGFRLIPDMPVSITVRWLSGLWLVLSVFVIPLGMLARTIKQQPLGDRLAWVGLLAMGFFSSLLVLTFVRDLTLASLMTVDAMRPGTIPLERWRTGTAAAVPLLALLSTLIGLFNARRRARVVTIEVPIDDLPAALDGFTIVQISDIHVGPTIKRRYVDAIVDAVNRLKPDLIAVTGDVVDGSVPAVDSPHAAALAVGCASRRIPCTGTRVLRESQCMDRRVPSARTPRATERACGGRARRRPRHNCRRDRLFSRPS